ncbi:hypothetical protein DACRYDRAFT_25656, partial [Dacryopinax primogenitus]
MQITRTLVLATLAVGIAARPVELETRDPQGSGKAVNSQKPGLYDVFHTYSQEMKAMYIAKKGDAEGAGRAPRQERRAAYKHHAAAEAMKKAVGGRSLEEL